MSGTKNDFFDLGAVIRMPTEYKQPSPPKPPPDSGMADDYFHQSPPRENLAFEKPSPLPQRKTLDPDITADITISTFDSIQNVGFFTAYSRKYKGRIFADFAEYKKALDVSYTPENAKEKLSEEDQILMAKIIDFQNKIRKISPRLPFTVEEKEKLKGPLKAMIEVHNFDIPPGLALAIVASEIFVTRIIDFRAE